MTYRESYNIHSCFPASISRSVRNIHAVVYQWFVPFHVWVVFHCENGPQFIHFPSGGHWVVSSLQNKAAVNIHVFLCGNVLLYTGNWEKSLWCLLLKIVHFCFRRHLICLDPHFQLRLFCSGQQLKSLSQFSASRLSFLTCPLRVSPAGA